MTRLPDCPPGIARKALRPDSKVRWNWEDQHAYQITDNRLYDSRCDHFRQFRTDFYSGLESGPVVHESDLIACRVCLSGVGCCGDSHRGTGNDCFCRVGEIRPIGTSRVPEAIGCLRGPDRGRGCGTTA